MRIVYPMTEQTDEEHVLVDTPARRREALAVAANILGERIKPDRPHKIVDDVVLLNRMRDELAGVAFLITPHGEKIPIPRHVAAQIQTILYIGDQPMRIEIPDDDDEPERSVSVATMTQEDPEWRILRAFANGYREGLERGSHGQLDHS